MLGCPILNSSGLALGWPPGDSIWTTGLSYLVKNILYNWILGPYQTVILTGFNVNANFCVYVQDFEPYYISLTSGESHLWVVGVSHIDIACLVELLLNKISGYQGTVEFFWLAALHICCHMLLGEISTECVTPLREDNRAHVWCLLNLPSMLFFFPEYNLYTLAIKTVTMSIKALLGPVSPSSESSDLRIVLWTSNTWEMEFNLGILQDL